ncbi:MAG TPA: PEP-CTERM sorting domain-containing protein [Phycisphaerae bacterium]|nr:PEP-CTERM sorting domain-containing protein [Phycisphaerae bacterium]
MMISRKTRAHLGLAVVAAAAFAVTSAAKADVIAQWTFENSPLTSTATTVAANTPFTNEGPETGSGSAIGYHLTATAYSAPAGNGSPKSFSSNAWSVGDYYEFDVSTAAYTGVSLSFDQTGSATGPAQFKVQYNAGSGWLDLASGAYTIPNTTTTASAGTTSIAWNTSGAANTATSFTFDLSSISGLTGIRLVDNGTTPIGTSSAVGTGGTSRVDNVTFTGTSSVPEPATAAIAAVGAAFMIGRRRR